MAASPQAPDSPPRHEGVAWLSVTIASVPALALTLGIPFANRVEPTVFGLPFLLAWIVGWILLTPVCMAVVHRLDRRRR